MFGQDRVFGLMPTGYQEAEPMSAELQKACVSFAANLVLATLFLDAALLLGSKVPHPILTPREDRNPYSPRK